MKVLTLDIGGANTKYALFVNNRLVESRIIYNPIWKVGIEDVLREIERKTKPDIVASTFTAELSDVFENKKKGICYLTEICKRIFGKIYFLTVDRELVSDISDVEEPRKLAAANFVASVYFLEKKYGNGILVDMGSTTTDIVPFKLGKILYFKTDLERMMNNQLVYIGFLRTPLNTIKNSVVFRGRNVRLAGEYFAITADLFRVLGYKLKYSCDTPDGKGKDRESCMRRIARLLCSDIYYDIDVDEIIEVCIQIKNEIVSIILASIKEIFRKYNVNKAYLAGIGAEFLEEICKSGGLEYSVLERKISENLPCIGLYEIVKDRII